MNAPMLQSFANAAGAATAIAINSLWEDALLVVCVWLLLRAWPGLNAATRYLVWSATLVATVIVPIATTLPFLASPPPVTAVTGTTVRVPMPMVTHALIVAPGARFAEAPASKKSQNAQSANAASSAAPQTPAAAPRFPERFRMTLPLPLALTVLGLWGLLAAVSFARLAIGLFRLEQLKRDALPLPVEYREAMQRWTEVNKGSRQVRLCVSDEIDVPVAVGLFDSMILIPRPLLDRLSETEVDQISLHELAHLRRADDWSNGLQRVVIALFAWNPGVQFVGQQLDLEREVACDDWVLTLTGQVRPYALCLTKMAETSSWPRHPVPAPGVFATRKHISLRIERLLGAGRNVATNLSLGPAAATVAIVGALAFAMQLVAPSVAASVQSSESAGVHASNLASAKKPWAEGMRTREIFRFMRVAETQTTQTKSTTPATTQQSVKAAVSSPKPTPVVAASPKTPAAAAATSTPQKPTSVHVPATHVHVAGQTITIPPINVDIPEMNVPLANSAQLQQLHQARISQQEQLHLAQRVAASMHSNVAIHVAAGDAADAAADAAAEARASGAFGISRMRFNDASSARTCSGCDLSGVDWSGRDVHGANYTGVDLSRSKLQGTNFSGGTFNGVDFSRANLRNASFRNARLTGCDFSRADLTGVDFTGASITGCQFTGAQLPSSQIRAVLNTCTGCDFSHANLSGLDLTHVRTSGIDFSGANLSGANLSDSQFTGADFGHARLDGVNLTNTVFNGCDLGSVDLSHVDLSRAKLIGTDLSTRGSPHP